MVTAVVAVAVESHVAEVLLADPPRQRVAPDEIVNVPFANPGPVGVVLKLKTPAVIVRSAPDALFIVIAAPSFITVAALLIVNLWKVVAADSKVGVPLAEVMVTVEVSWVKVPVLVRRVPEVPVSVSV